MLGLAGPVAVGVLAGHGRIGMAASLGGLALSRGEKGETLREQAPGLAYSLTAVSAAMLAGTAVGSHGTLTPFAVPAIAAAAGLLGSMSRPLARATTQFILFLIIAAYLGAGGARPMGMMLLFLLGAVWTAGLSLALRPLFRVLHLSRNAETAAVIDRRPTYSPRQLLRRWQKSLTRLSGWQYTLRITLCLAAAQAVVWLWPLHHGYWVAITVMIAVQRNLRTALTRTLHRAAGTLLGVLFTCVLLLGSWPLWGVVALIAALSAMRPVLMEVNYTAYAAVQTPLVILLLDFGRKPTGAVAFDRLACTLIGCGLALTLGYPGWPKLSAAKTRAS
jgi:hypothetical protein